MGSGLRLWPHHRTPPPCIHAPDGARCNYWIGLGPKAQACLRCLLAFDYAGDPLRARPRPPLCYGHKAREVSCCARKLAGGNFAPEPCTPRPRCRPKSSLPEGNKNGRPPGARQMVDDAGCLIDSAAANPSLSSYLILPEISETTMSFVVYSRHSTSVQIASVDCELLTRGDSRRVTRERFPALNLLCSYGSSYLAYLPIMSYYVR